MGKIVAFLSACTAWILFSAPAVLAAGIFAEISTDDILMSGQYPPGSDVRSLSFLSFGIFETPSVQARLFPSDGREAGNGSARGWSVALLTPAAADLFSGSSMTAGGATCSVDPHTFCMTITGSGYGMCETCVPAEGRAFGGHGRIIRSSSSPASQPVFMAIAGVTLIGLSCLGRTRKSDSPVRVYGVQHPLQPWKTRSWKDQPVKERPAYQVKAA